MQATATDLRSSSLPLGSIRTASPHDLADVARLLGDSGIDMRSIEAELQCSSPGHHLIVFDLDGVIRAVARVEIALDRGLRGELPLLVVDPQLAHTSARAIQDRLTGVAIALCEAYECKETIRGQTRRQARILRRARALADLQADRS